MSDRAFRHPVINELAKRLQALIGLPAMDVPVERALGAVLAKGAVIPWGQTCKEWLVLRARELPWIERTLAAACFADTLPDLGPVDGPLFPLVPSRQLAERFLRYEHPGLTRAEVAGALLVFTERRVAALASFDVQYRADHA